MSDKTDSYNAYCDSIKDIEPLTSEQELELAKRIAEGDKKAKDELINHNLRLVISIAMRYEKYCDDRMELISVGNEGLIKAAEKFDYTRGVKFGTYAYPAIENSIRKVVSDKMTGDIETTRKKLKEDLGREPSDEELAEKLNMSEKKVKDILTRIAIRKPSSLDEPIDNEDNTSTRIDRIEDTSSLSPEEEAIHSEEKERLDAILSQFSEEQQSIFKLRFGLKDGQCHTFEEVGTELGMSRHKVYEIETAFIRELKRKNSTYLQNKNGK